MASECTRNDSRCIISTQDIVYRMDTGELRGGLEPAAALAAELARANPRKRAFVDELRKAGFAV